MKDSKHNISCECGFEWESIIDHTGQEVCPECRNFDTFETI